jgi:CelD/BcsL family acetyltransferase involved in cellulose biosynthesis
MPLDMSWVRGIEALRPLYPEWASLSAETGGEVFLTPDWIETWWTVLSKGRDLRCLVARKDGRLIGVLPFVIQRIWAGPVPFRVARFAGTDPHCMIFHLPVQPDAAVEMLREALGHLLAEAGCHVVSLTPVSEASDLLPLITAACAADARLMLTDLPDGIHTMFELPTDFEALLAGFSKSRRGQFRRDRKQLVERYEMQNAVFAPDAEKFRQFITFHNQQWQAVGKGGNFTDWPENAALYPVMAERTIEKPLVRFHEQTGKTGPLSTQFTLVSGKTCHWRLPARTLDPEAEKLSVGKVSLLMMIEDLIGLGISRIEAGRGDYDYKSGMGAKSLAVHRMIVAPATAMGRLRLKLLLGWADLLNLVYYRIWFLKLLPKVRRLTGLAARPLWSSWIRTRL